MPSDTPKPLTAGQPKPWEEMEPRERDVWIAVNVYGYSVKRIPAYSQDTIYGHGIEPSRNSFPSHDSDLFYLGDHLRFSTDYHSENNMFYRDGNDPSKGTVEWLPHYSDDAEAATDLKWFIGQNWDQEQQDAFREHVNRMLGTDAFAALEAFEEDPGVYARAAYYVLRAALRENSNAAD